jgi:hypothetical protein
VSNGPPVERFATSADLSRIAPLPLADVDEMISETSPSPEPDAPINQKPSDDAPRSTAPNQTQIKSRQARKLSSKQKSTRSSRNKRPAGGQLSPPATLTSSRNVSKSTTVDKVDEGVAVGHDTGEEISPGAESAHNGLRKGLVTKRKAKKPVVCSRSTRWPLLLCLTDESNYSSMRHLASHRHS